MNAIHPIATPGVTTQREARLQSLLADIRARREEFQTLRHIPHDIVEQFVGLGLYRAFVARRFGGDEITPMDFLDLIERISVADGSAGWVASFGCASTYLASLPASTLATLYADGPDVIFAGGIYPPQPVRRTPAGFLVSGRWGWLSGCMSASVVGGGIAETDSSTQGLPRLAVMPRASVTIDPVWDSIGLRGTGSHDMIADNVLVPEEWTFVRGGPPSIDIAITRYPAIAIAAQVLAVVGLGVARAALDEVAAIAGSTVSITGAPSLASRPHVQSEIAKAEASLRAARAWFYDITADVWDTVQRGDPASPEQTNLLRLAASHAARTGADVTRAAFIACGTTGIHAGHPLGRYLQDAAVVAQHAFLSEGTYQTAGQQILNPRRP
jgi:alkylation response protein AidB-like acyl-CoA dehydrogenase